MQSINKSILSVNRFSKAVEIILSILVAVMVCFYLIIAFLREVNVDATFYLGVVDSIYSGLVPILDFPLAYTPLSFYLLQVIRLFTHDYAIYLVVLFLITVASSFVLYKITFKLSTNKILSRLAQLLFLIQVFLFEGTYFVLEPFAVLFGLLSIWFLLKKNMLKYIFLSGIFAGAAFMSKQYGLAFLAGCLVYIIFTAGEFKEKIKHIIWLCLGFAVIPLLFLLYFLIIGIDLSTILGSFMGTGYGKRSDFYWLQGTFKLFNYRYFLTIFLFPLFFVLYKKRKLIPLALSLLVTIFLLTFQFYFQLFDHYYILIIPLILLLFSLIFLYNNKYLKLGVLILLFLSCCYLGKKVVRDTYYVMKSNPKHLQNVQVNKIRAQIKNSDTIFCLGVKYVNYYYLLDKKPPLFSEYGYSFGNETEKEIMEKVKSADVIIADTNYFDANYQSYVYINKNFNEVYRDDEITVLRDL